MTNTTDLAETKRRLAADIAAAGEAIATKLGSLPADGFERGGYENGWNGHQILAHLAAVEWTYPRLIDLASAANQGGQGDISGFDIDAYNNKQVEKRAGKTVADLIEEFQRNRVNTVAAVEAVDEALLSVPIKSAGGISGTLAEVLRYTTIEHVEHHVADMSGSA
jgi:uncharacterized damage-inducible protein DinB